MNESMIRFAFTPEGAAGVFLRKHAASVCGKREQRILGAIIRDAWKEGLIASLEHAKHEYREVHSGGCKMYSKGDACYCFLCRMDAALSAVARIEAEDLGE